MISSATLSYALDEVVSVLAYESFYGQPFFMPELYSVRTSSRRRERTASFDGLTEYEVKAETAAPAEDSIVNQYEKDFVHQAFAKQVPLSRELVDDQEWGLLEDLGMQLGAAAAYTMEKYAAAPFVDAFTGATYLAEDAKSICNDAHTNVAGGNSQDNKGTTALSMTAVKATRIAMRKFKNYKGDFLSVNPDALIIPVDLEEDAWEIAKSTLRPDNANMAANIYNGMFDMYVWPFLTDVNDWFMVDRRLMKMNLLWFQRVGLEIFGEGSLLTGTKKIGGYFRFSHGVRDWRWIYGHQVA